MYKPPPENVLALHIEENSQAPQLRASSSCAQTKAKNRGGVLDPDQSQVTGLGMDAAQPSLTPAARGYFFVNATSPWHSSA